MHLLTQTSRHCRAAAGVAGWSLEPRAHGRDTGLSSPSWTPLGKTATRRAHWFGREAQTLESLSTCLDFPTCLQRDVRRPANSLGGEEGASSGPWLSFLASPSVPSANSARGSGFLSLTLLILCLRGPHYDPPPPTHPLPVLGPSSGLWQDLSGD